MAGNWIERAVGKNPGGLHRSTGTPSGEKIPSKKMAKAASGGFGPKARKEAALANTLSKLRKR